MKVEENPKRGMVQHSRTTESEGWAHARKIESYWKSKGYSEASAWARKVKVEGIEHWQTESTLGPTGYPV